MGLHAFPKVVYLENCCRTTENIQSVHSKASPLNPSEDGAPAGSQSPQKANAAAGAPAAVSVPTPVVPPEPLGAFNNPHGKPQVVHDDPYLEPFVDDLYLRQKEYKK